ncbi:hypothetical protein KKB99_05975 [bacterium]|nr:hypothetical protein [bacterium]MBU1025535.1 hypothetical protein [bacterium]
MMKDSKNSRVLIHILIPLILLIIFLPEPGLNAQPSSNPSRKLADFYPIQRNSLEMGWQQVAGFNGQNIEYIRKVAKKYNFHPADVAAVLIADSASRFAWPGGLPNEIPIGFMQSQTGISQIPPGMAVSHRLMSAGPLVPGARKRFKYMNDTILQPEKGVDYWFKALAEESYDVMKDPQVNIGIATRYMRRVADAAINLYKPDAKESIKIDDKSLLPDQHIRWVDEFDWGRLMKYMRNNMLWDQSYEFDLTEFAPSFKRKSELNMMIFYSEYRTAPPFDGSWFFEAMYLMRETHRWLNSREDILKMLEPINEPAEVYFEYVEDYSFYQDEWEILNPGRIHPDNLPQLESKSESDNDNAENDEDEKEDSDKDKKKKRKPRGKYE